jgi:hypothetical protein
MIQPIDSTTVTKALKAMFQEDEAIGGIGVRVERSEQFDTPDDAQGFVGVYKDKQRFPARTLGNGAGSRRQLIDLVVLLRESNYTSGEECEDALEQLAKNVIRVLLSDTSLRGTVDMLVDEFDIRYDSYDKAGGLWVQKAAISFTAEVRVR